MESEAPPAEGRRPRGSRSRLRLDAQRRGEGRRRSLKGRAEVEKEKEEYAENDDGGGADQGLPQDGEGDEEDMAEDSPLISRTQSRSKDLKSDDKKSFAPKGQLAAVDAENRKRAEAEQQRADVLAEQKRERRERENEHDPDSYLRYTEEEKQLFLDNLKQSENEKVKRDVMRRAKPSIFPYQKPEQWQEHTAIRQLQLPVELRCCSHPCCSCLVCAQQHDDDYNDDRAEDYEEGLFVPEQPNVSIANEHRLLIRRRWDLKEDRKRIDAGKVPGRVLEKEVFTRQTQPDPLSHLHTRPMRWYDVIASWLQTKYQYPVVPTDRTTTSKVVTGGVKQADQSVLNVQDQQYYVLTVHLQSLVFDDHELFEKEDWHAARLMQLYNQWRFGKQQHVVETLKTRIYPLTRAIEEVIQEVKTTKAQGEWDINKEAAVTSKGGKEADRLLQLWTKQRRLCRELRQVRQSIRDEQSSRNQLVMNMMNEWKTIKHLRATSKIQRTSVEVKLRKSKTTKSNIDEQVMVEKEELKELFKVDLNYKLVLVVKDLASKERDVHDAEAQLKALRKRVRPERDPAMQGIEGPDAIPPDEGDIENCLKSIDALMRSKEKLSARKKDLEDRLRDGLNDGLLEQKINDQIQACKHATFTIAGADQQGDDDVEFEPVLLVGSDRNKEPPPIFETVRLSKKDADYQDAEEAERFKAEQRDKTMQNSWKIYARLFANGHAVGCTPAVTLAPDFVLNFNTSFALELVSWPESIVVELYRERRLLSALPLGNDELLGRMYIIVPGAHGAAKLGAAATLYRFQGVEPIRPWTLIVEENSVISYLTSEEGAAERGRGDTRQPDRFNTGTFKMVAKWGRVRVSGENDFVDVEDGFIPDLPRRPANITGEELSVDLQRLHEKFHLSNEEMYGHTGMDPNDPRNIQTMDGMTGDENAEVVAVLNKPTFRLQADAGLLDCLMEDGELAIERDELLSKRHRAALQRQRTRDQKEVKLLDDQIDLGEFGEEEDDGAEDDYGHERVKRFVEAIQRQFERNRSLTRKRLSVTDNVREPSPFGPDEDEDSTWFAKMFLPQRPLKPIRHDPLPLLALEGGAKLHLLVIIIRGYDFPQEKSAMERGQRSSSRMSSVEVRFQDSRESSPPAAGNDPQWNNTLRMEVHTETDRITPSQLQQVMDPLVLNVFDEGSTSDEDHLRIGERPRNFMGSIEIPFQTIYLNGRVEGVYELKAPIISRSFPRENKHGEQKAAGPQLEIFITTDPSMAPPPTLGHNLGESRVPADDPTFAARCLKFLKQARDKSNCRDKNDIIVAAPDVGQRSVFLTQFVTYLKPPERILKKFSDDRAQWKRNCRSQLLRIVSVIPHVEDWVASSGQLDNVWCTSHQFLHICAGSTEEHAVLLCNYFLWLKQEGQQVRDAWVIIGRAHPQGATHWVLTKDLDQDRGILWDPTNGVRYDLDQNNAADVQYCPLQEVIVVFNDRDLFVNIRPDTAPVLGGGGSSDWLNFGDTKQWMSFFEADEDSIHRSKKIQETDLFYTKDPNDKNPDALEDSRVRDLALEIKAKIKEEIERDWEDEGIIDATAWTNAVENMLLSSLKEFEACKMKGKEQEAAQQEYTKQLFRLLDNKQKSGTGWCEIRGDPIHLKYTDIDAVVKEVKDRCIHKNVPTGTKFELAVYVEPLIDTGKTPVYSVWVYLISEYSSDRKPAN